ncbi:hypothetical protein BKA83DRAFT_1436009 [Pisolithus microcarpus]|nr:hypothetical protein BKA83DRAFT_1436009 [Pisolithus microcarpus]
MRFHDSNFLAIRVAAMSFLAVTLSLHTFAKPNVFIRPQQSAIPAIGDCHLFSYELLSLLYLAEPLRATALNSNQISQNSQAFLSRYHQRIYGITPDHHLSLTCPHGSRTPARIALPLDRKSAPSWFCFSIQSSPSLHPSLISRGSGFVRKCMYCYVLQLAAEFG